MRISVVVHVSCIYDVGSFCLIFLINSFASLSPSRNLRAVTHSESEEIKFKVYECSYYLFFLVECVTNLLHLDDLVLSVFVPFDRCVRYLRMR